MQSPYAILDVAEDANDREIKQAYLQKVKSYPPDRSPEQFQSINTAYLAIKDSKSRMRHALFNLSPPDFDELLDKALATRQTVRLGPEQFDKLLRASSADRTLLAAFSTSDNT